MERRNPNESLLLELAAAESGAPLSVTEDDLRARFAVIIRRARADGWSEDMRGECRRITEALERLEAGR
jgi:hypothetical protein